MLRLVTTGLVLVLLWGLYWVGAGWVMQTGVTRWFEAQAARGWQAEFTGLELSGFPNRHVTRIETPALADPATGATWRADWIDLDARAIWPGHVQMRFADTPQLFSYFDQRVTLLAKALGADLRLRPGTALELDALSLRSGPWSISQQGAQMLGADSLTLSLTQSDVTEVYDLQLDAQTLTPGARLRAVARLSGTLPDSFSAFQATATLTFDKPWDRSALEQARPQPRHVELHLAEAAWGALRLSAAGTFDVGAEGIPDGLITIRAENWREMLTIAETYGALPAEARRAADQTLGFLAGLGGNPNALDVQLNLRGGIMALGPIPLGPAPRLLLR